MNSQDLFLVLSGSSDFSFRALVFCPCLDWGGVGWGWRRGWRWGGGEEEVDRETGEDSRHTHVHTHVKEGGANMD